MPRYVAFLRAINVGGRVVKMATLSAEFEALGLARVETFIASGNVIFETAARSTEALERKIERRLLDALGWEVATFLRTDAEVAAVAACRPFPAALIASSRTFVVGFLEREPDARASAKLMAIRTPDDEFALRGREVYWLPRLGQGQSKLSNAAVEKALGMRSTMRGMSTMAKLTAKYPPAGAVGRPAKPARAR
jgi:uncharacterized protein (DUF1697 family)